LCRIRTLALVPSVLRAALRDTFSPDSRGYSQGPGKPHRVEVTGRPRGRLPLAGGACHFCEPFPPGPPPAVARPFPSSSMLSVPRSQWVFPPSRQQDLSSVGQEACRAAGSRTERGSTDCRTSPSRRGDDPAALDICREPAMPPGRRSHSARQ
jgi:hypothetical protein